LQRGYLGLLRQILEGDGWKKYGIATIAALELMPMAFLRIRVPTLCLKLLDRASDALIDSALPAASYAYRRAKEAFGGLEPEVRAEMCRMCLTNLQPAAEMGEHTVGPIRSTLRAREERRKRLLEGLQHDREAPHRAGHTVAQRTKTL
jgi:hypothetical protein